MERYLYELPKGWEWNHLGDYCQLENGDRGKNYPSRSAFITSGVPVINAGSLIDNEIDTASLNYISRERYDLLGGGKVREKDLLFCLRGSLGKSAIVQGLSEGAIASSLVIVRPESALDTEYLQAYFNSHLCALMIEKYDNGSAQPNLSSKSLKKFQIPLPPLNEQKRIVAKLDALFTRIDTAITHLRQNLELTKALFASALSEKFESRNKSWQFVKLTDVCSITSKLLDPREPEYIDLIHVGGANIESLTGSLIGLKTAREEKLISGKFMFDDKMVLYSKIRPYLMKVARPNINGLCSADIYPLTPESGVLDRDFLFYLFLSEDFTAYVIQGSSRAGMPKVNRKHLFDYEFSMPSFEEQKQITAHLDYLSERTHALETAAQEKLDDLATLKASLLDAAFKGQL